MVNCSPHRESITVMSSVFTCRRRRRRRRLQRPAAMPPSRHCARGVAQWPAACRMDEMNRTSRASHWALASPTFPAPLCPPPIGPPPAPIAGARAPCFAEGNRSSGAPCWSVEACAFCCEGSSACAERRREPHREAQVCKHSAVLLPGATRPRTCCGRARAQQDIVRLHVSVLHALRMQILQRCRDILKDERRRCFAHGLRRSLQH